MFRNSLKIGFWRKLQIQSTEVSVKLSSIKLLSSIYKILDVDVERKNNAFQNGVKSTPYENKNGIYVRKIGVEITGAKFQKAMTIFAVFLHSII